MPYRKLVDVVVDYVYQKLHRLDGDTRAALSPGPHLDKPSQASAASALDYLRPSSVQAPVVLILVL